MRSAMTRGLLALALIVGSVTAMASDIIFTDGFDDYTLSVNKTGTGFGTLTSTPAGVDCGSTCAFIYIQNTIVALLATPATASYFTGWGGACAGTISTCNVTMNVAKPVSADFIFTGSDPFNCGGSGVVCRGDQTCSASSCVCRPGLTANTGPGPGCVDLQSDPNHCGTLGTVCSTSLGSNRCLNGTCQSSCGALTACSAPISLFACVKLASDPLNCGGCANRCAVDEVCIAGTCKIYPY